MTTADFNALQYGNTFRDLGTGQLFIVTFTNRDASGNTTEVGVMPAFAVSSAPGLAIVSKNVGQTVIQGNQNGQLILNGQTIQGPPVAATESVKKA